MSRPLESEDFASFFHAVHGVEPFPWQKRLAAQVLEEGKWPDILDLPTGAGKTSVLDIAVFHLAMEADRLRERHAPVRIVFVVDRRLVVDDVYRHANQIKDALTQSQAETAKAVAERLATLSDDSGVPLMVQRLRGGVPHEGDWARSPMQPTILCSTVDQVGSRLLFRGYGVSDRMKSIHAGLLGADCRFFLDEAHLAEPFRQTLEWVRHYRGDVWRENSESESSWGYTLLTATPQSDDAERFELGSEDYEHPIFRARWTASKPTRLYQLPKVSPARAESSDEEQQQLVREVLNEVKRGLAELNSSGVKAPAFGVVVNRVGRARAVFNGMKSVLRDAFPGQDIKPMFLIGPSRSLERDQIAEILREIRTESALAGQVRSLSQPMIVVATQCIEVGVDLDLDGLVTEAASIDSLRQRFGRLNRAGRDVSTFASVVAAHSAIQEKSRDSVYGASIQRAWDYLTRNAQRSAENEGTLTFDFGLAAFDSVMKADAIPADALSPKPDAPVLLPAHLDLLSQTWPIPSADPEVGLFLHGNRREPDAVTVIWRGDLHPEQDSATVRRLLGLVPPRVAEAIELPVWAVKRWLRHVPNVDAMLSDAAGMAPDETQARSPSEHKVFRWLGDDDRSLWVFPGQIRPGDTIVVPASYGGVDHDGWNPESKDVVVDLGTEANYAFARRRFAVRIAPGLIAESREVALATLLAEAHSRPWRDLLDDLLEFNNRVDESDRRERWMIQAQKSIQNGLTMLGAGNDTRGANVTKVKQRSGKVTVITDLYGTDDQGRPLGVVLLAEHGVQIEDEVLVASTEDDAVAPVPNKEIVLRDHCRGVGEKAEMFARMAGMSEERVRDIRVAGWLHDIGKGDSRFQRWLAYGDLLAPDPKHLLAKSKQVIPPTVREKVGLPHRWRHEGLSVRLAPLNPMFSQAQDPELVLWLIGTHHGYGRVFFPHADPLDKEARNADSVDPVYTTDGEVCTLAPGDGPQSLAYAWNGRDWPSLYESLKDRYGVWELARMEAILRLADHRVSEEEASSTDGGAA